jgi:predicted MPP superfamily phosphohydrolase
VADRVLSGVRLLTAATALVGVGAVVYGRMWERHHVRVREIAIEVPHLPRSFAGYRIALLSDFHIGGRKWSPVVMARAAALAAAQHADLIAVTGDFVETTAAIETWVDLFGPLRAPDGVVAVLGNHDYFDQAIRVAPLVAALEHAGIRVLRNAATFLERGADRLWIVGLDDAATGHDYLPRALEGVPPDARPLLLVHYPDFTWRLAPGRWALALSGHAPGSQVRVPLVAKYLREHIAHTRFSHGLYRINGIPVYVTTGIGTSGRPLRLFAPPEVAVISLHLGRC